MDRISVSQKSDRIASLPDTGYKEGRIASLPDNRYKEGRIGSLPDNVYKAGPSRQSAGYRI